MENEKFTLLPCFCGNQDQDEFLIKKNKIQCLNCNTIKISSTSLSRSEMVGLWNTRGNPENRFNLSHEQSLLLDRYFQSMCKEMISNNHKGDMVTSWNPDLYQLIAETSYHMAKLNKAMIEVDRNDNPESRKEVNEFSADIGNYMAKIQQILGIKN